VSTCDFAVGVVPGPTRVPAIFWKQSLFAPISLQGEPAVDEADRKILNAIQSEFPITARPYKELGRRLALSEEEVLHRVKRLKEEGIIRRIGGNFHSGKLDFTSTLCAAKVPEERIERFVEVVNRYPGVTHNYLRNHEFNVWFTFIAPSEEAIAHSLDEISAVTGVKEVHSLPAVRMFKIKVDFEV
jgi:DNA-binding Lrp family transcriptional regulator